MRFKMGIHYPDYISIFSASGINSNEWSTVSALGKKDHIERIVVRFFTGNAYFTVFSTSNYNEAIDKGRKFSELLQVELNNTLEP